MTALNIPPKPTASDIVDNVNRPKHYQSPNPIEVELIIKGGDNPGKAKFKVHIHIQALDVIKAWGLQKDGYLFNVVKYVLRSGKKGDEAQYLEDLKKARFYLNEKIAEMEEELA